LKRRRFQFIGSNLTRLALFSLIALAAIKISGARELSDYRLGDVLEEDMVAPAVLVVPDPAATAGLKTSEAYKTLAIFRFVTDITNDLAGQFSNAFDTARSSFRSALQDSFHGAVLDHASIMSPDFGYLLTAYNFDHPSLPIPGRLAMDWAYGKDGEVEKATWLREICAFMQNPIRPDSLPGGFAPGDTVSLVPVSRRDEVLTNGDLANRARQIPLSSMASLSQAQLALRREITRDEDPLLARALAAWLQPNCFPDPALTQETRDAAVRRMVVAEYFSAGQVIAPKGCVVDDKIMAALDQLRQKPAEIPVISADQLQEAQVPVSGDSQASLDNAIMADPGPPLPAATPDQLADDILPNLRLMGAAAAVAVIAVVLIQHLPRRPTQVSSVAVFPRGLESKHSPRLETELAPQILQVVRQAFVQELAGQRRDLLMTQQAAAAEVVRLVQRMDSLQIAMQDRLRTYEGQIQQLEAELTARKEENLQLIRLKIQMIRHQVNLETSPQRVELN
jgi:hypothetical protein